MTSAITLLKVLCHDLASLVEVSVLRRELKAAQFQLKCLEVEDVRLRQELQRRAPRIPQDRLAWGGCKHERQIVHRILEFIHAHYCRPLQLGDVADALKLNACYLSGMFSRTLGVTFHHYLEELRLATAKQLLRRSDCRVCEVAAAAGFSSSGHFWRVFKAHTGASPRLWREGVHVHLGRMHPNKWVIIKRTANCTPERDVLLVK